MKKKPDWWNLPRPVQEYMIWRNFDDKHMAHNKYDQLSLEQTKELFDDTIMHLKSGLKEIDNYLVFINK